MDAIHGAARKYRVQPEELPARLEEARARLAEMGESGDLETLRKLEDEAHAACLAEAKKLSAGRKRAAKKLSDEVTAQMQVLAMEGGRFEAALAPTPEVTAHGMESVDFLVAAHKGMAPQPLRANARDAASARFEKGA